MPAFIAGIPGVLAGIGGNILTGVGIAGASTALAIAVGASDEIVVYRRRTTDYDSVAAGIDAVGNRDDVRFWTALTPARPRVLAPQAS
jgi:hypothetical protein